MPLLILSLLFCLILSSCGQTTAEKDADIMLSANIMLSKSKCAEAITLLENNGRRPSDVNYTKTLASAYACKAGFKATTFYGSDISNTATPAPMGGVSKYTTSAMETPDTTAFLALMTAIKILTHTGDVDANTNPTSAARDALIGSTENADVNTQILYYSLAALGMFDRLYGGASATTGIKSNCFFPYSNLSLTVGTDLSTYLGTGATGACTAVSTSVTTYLGTHASPNYTRLCYGTVLVNNVLDTLTGLAGTLSGNVSSSTSNITSAFALLKSGLNTATSNAVSYNLSVQDVDLCVANNTTPDNLEYYYAFIMETMFK